MSASSALRLRPTRIRVSAISMALAVTLLLLMPAVQAGPSTLGPFEAQSAAFEGEIEMVGQGTLGWISVPNEGGPLVSRGDLPLMAHDSDTIPKPATNAILGLDVQAGRATVDHKVVRYIGLPSLPGAIASGDAKMMPTMEMRNPTMTLDAAESTYRMQVRSLTPGTGFDVALAAMGGTAHAVEGVVMDRCGVRGSSESSDECRDNQAEFATVTENGPLVHVKAASIGHIVEVSGDLVLEFTGVSITAEDEVGKTESLDGRSKTGPVQTDTGLSLPAESQAVVYETEYHYITIKLTNARLQFVVEDEKAFSSWVYEEVSVLPQGKTTFANATGDLNRDGVQFRYNNEDAVLEPGNFRIDMLAREQMLDLDVVPAGSDAPRTTGTFLLPKNTSTWLGGSLVAVGVAAMAVAAAILVRRRVAGLPHISGMEKALAEGRFSSAARMAKRILDKEPGMEDAAIGRAIALHKGGRSRLAVREVRKRFRDGREPTDGVLHYVMGLACIDLGRNEEAQEAMRQAVRRTPSLLGEVKAYFPSLFSEVKEAVKAATPVRSPHGDGYA